MPTTRRLAPCLAAAAAAALLAAASAGASRRVSTVAGTGKAALSGTGRPATDGVPATSTRAFDPTGIAALPNGGLLSSEPSQNRVRMVDPTGLVTTVAGTGARGFAGDGGSADVALLNRPAGVAALPAAAS